MRELRWRLIQFLKVAGPSKPDAIIRAIEAHGFKETEARSCIWKMLGSYDLVLDYDRNLVLPGVHGGVE